MGSSKKSILFYFLYLAVLQISSADDKDIDPKLKDFLDIHNGLFDNRAQINSNTTSFDFVQIRLLTVKVPVLGEGSHLFIDVAINGRSHILQVATLSAIGDIVYLKGYSFTEPSKYRFMEYRVSDLSKLPFSNFTTDDQCVGAFVSLDDGVFTGSYPDCSTLNDGRHPTVFVTFTRRNASGFAPEQIVETKPSIPYVFERVYV